MIKELLYKKKNNETIKQNLRENLILSIFYLIFGFILIFFLIFGVVTNNFEMAVLGGIGFIICLIYIVGYGLFNEILYNRLEIREGKIELWLKIHNENKLKETKDYLNKNPINKK